MKIIITENRLEQSKFRETIIKRDKQCLISGDDSEICEACHIIPYNESKNCNSNNGILLNRCFHNMFDKYLFSINLNDEIEFSNKILNDNKYKNYHIYQNKKIKINNNDIRENLKIHYKKFIENI